MAFGVFENATGSNCALGTITSRNEFSVAPSSGLTVGAGGLTPTGNEIPVAGPADVHAAPQGRFHR